MCANAIRGDYSKPCPSHSCQSLTQSGISELNVEKRGERSAERVPRAPSPSLQGRGGAPCQTPPRAPRSQPCLPRPPPVCQHGTCWPRCLPGCQAAVIGFCPSKSDFSSCCVTGRERGQDVPATPEVFTSPAPLLAHRGLCTSLTRVRRRCPKRMALRAVRSACLGLVSPRSSHLAHLLPARGDTPGTGPSLRPSPPCHKAPRRHPAFGEHPVR